MPEPARTSSSFVTCVTVRLVAGAAAPRRDGVPGADDAAISSGFHASQAGHWPCHWAVLAPQEPHT